MMLAKKLKTSTQPGVAAILSFLIDEGFEPLVESVYKAPRIKYEFEVRTLYYEAKNLIQRELALIQWCAIFHENIDKNEIDISNIKAQLSMKSINYFFEKMLHDTFEKSFLHIQKMAYLTAKEEELLSIIKTYAIIGRQYGSLQRTEEHGIYMVTRKILLRRWMFLIQFNPERLSEVEKVLIKEESIKNKEGVHLFWGNEMAPTVKEKMLFFQLKLKHIPNRQILVLEESYSEPKTYTEKWHSVIIGYEKMLRGI